MSISQEEKNNRQTAIYRLKAIKYAEKNGIPKACDRYHVSQPSLYRWLKQWKTRGYTIESLYNASRRPKSHPNAHTEAEIARIRNLRRRHPNIGLQDLWLILRNKYGYTRTIQGLAKILTCIGSPTNQSTTPSSTYKKIKEYEQMKYPGQRVQIDVKEVPKACLSPEFHERHPFLKLYQYTSIDEYSRYRVLEGYLEHNAYSSSLFLGKVVGHWKQLGYRVKCMQTDNGTEFTKRFLTSDDDNLTQFEKMAIELKVKLKFIKPSTPKHNGKVERSHREDQRLLYSEIIRTNNLITDINDFRKRLKKHQERTNNRPMRPLDYLSPVEYLEQYKHKHPTK